MSPEKSSPQETPARQPKRSFDPRVLGYATLLMSLVGCHSTPKNTPLQASQAVVRTPETPTPEPPPLSEADAVAERQAFRQLYLYAQALYEGRQRREGLQRTLEIALPQDKKDIEEQLLECQLNLELTAFEVFKLVQTLNPRTWPRMLNALREISNGNMEMIRLRELSVEQFGSLAMSEDCSEVLTLQRAMFFQQVELLAIAVARMDKSIQHLEQLRMKADLEDQPMIEIRQNQLRTTRRSLIETLENGQMLPNTPQPPETLAPELLDHFIEKRSERGGLPRGAQGQPPQIRFGDGSMPGLDLRLIPPVQVQPQQEEAPGATPEPQRQEQRRPSRNRPRVASVDPQGIQKLSWDTPTQFLI